MRANPDPAQFPISCGRQLPLKFSEHLKAIPRRGTACSVCLNNPRGCSPNLTERRSVFGKGRASQHKKFWFSFRVLRNDSTCLKIDECALQRVEAKNVGKEPEKKEQPVKWGVISRAPLPSDSVHASQLRDKPRSPWGVVNKPLSGETGCVLLKRSGSPRSTVLGNEPDASLCFGRRHDAVPRYPH
jgi:hypothetical protein